MARKIGATLVGAALLAAPEAAACGPPMLETAIVQRISAHGDIVLADLRVLRLAGLHVARVQPDLWPKPGERIAIGITGEGTDRWSRAPSIVLFLVDGAPGAWLQQRLIESGTALARPEADLGTCWPLLAEAESAARGRLPDSPIEAGRFTRAEGRVLRVGEGRTAHFVTVAEATGQRVVGLVHKRHLRRLKEAGIDVAQLRGQVIRLRGVRSATNMSLIAVTMAEQIEIVR